MTERDIETLLKRVQDLWPRNKWAPAEWELFASDCTRWQIELAQAVAAIEQVKRESKYLTPTFSAINGSLERVHKSQVRDADYRRQPERIAQPDVPDQMPGGMGGFQAWKLWKSGRRDEVPREWWSLMQEAETCPLLSKFVKSSQEGAA